MTEPIEDTGGWVVVPAELLIDASISPAAKLTYLMLAQYPSYTLSEDGWEAKVANIIGMPLDLFMQGYPILLESGWAQVSMVGDIDSRERHLHLTTPKVGATA